MANKGLLVHVQKHSIYSVYLFEICHNWTLFLCFNTFGGGGIHF